MRQQAGRKKILDAALKLFAERGFHQTSVDQIAQAAKVSKGLTYNYFDSKEGLLLGIIESASDSMGDIAAGASSKAGYQIALQDFLARYGRLLETQGEFLTLQLNLIFDPGLKSLTREPLQRRAKHLLAQCEDLLARAGTTQSKGLARRLVSELDGIALHYLQVFDDYPLEAMLVQLYENYKDIGK